MAIPKFTAEASVNNDNGQHNQHLIIISEHKERVIPAAPYWGDFRREGCIGGGRRKYSSILWGSSDWENDCENTPAYITNSDGKTGRYYADVCDKQLLNMWGIFYVPESSCQSGRSCSCEDPTYTTERDCVQNGNRWCCTVNGIESCVEPGQL
jgi:hypothetical protein